MFILRQLANFFDAILSIYFWIVLITVILSWVPISSNNPTVLALLRLLRRATEPVFDFFRRTFGLQRYTYPIDITPMLVILAIHLLRITVVQTLRTLSPVANVFQAVFFLLHFALNIYFWIVAIAAFFILMICFFPQSQLAKVDISVMHNITEPVFEAIRRVFRYRLNVNFGNAPSPLDLAPFIALAIIHVVDTVILSFF